MNLNRITLLAAAISAAICAASSVDAQDRLIAGTEWRVERIGEDSVSQETEIFIQFQSDNKISGNGGCNRFFGTYTITGENISFGQIGATRMACPEPVMKLETLFFEALAKAANFEVLEFQMTISDNSENVLMNLYQTDRD